MSNKVLLAADNWRENQAMDGEMLIAAAQELVLDALRSAPTGLTNAEVGVKTGLNLPIRNQNGYISWTILQYLLQNDRIEKVEGRYRLKG